MKYVFVNADHNPRCFVKRCRLSEDCVPVMNMLEGDQDGRAAVDLHPGAAQPVGGHQAHLPPDPQPGPHHRGDRLHQLLGGLSVLGWGWEGNIRR